MKQDRKLSVEEIVERWDFYFGKFLEDIEDCAEAKIADKNRLEKKLLENVLGTVGIECIELQLYSFTEEFKNKLEEAGLKSITES